MGNIAMIIKEVRIHAASPGLRRRGPQVAVSLVR